MSIDCDGVGFVALEAFYICLSVQRNTRSFLEYEAYSE